NDSPLYLAATRGSLAIVKLLLANGAQKFDPDHVAEWIPEKDKTEILHLLSSSEPIEVKSDEASAKPPVLKSAGDVSKPYLPKSVVKKPGDKDESKDEVKDKDEEDAGQPMGPVSPALGDFGSPSLAGSRAGSRVVLETPSLSSKGQPL